MCRFLLTIAYDGSKFSGYQIQVNDVTVQGELQRVLSIIAKQPVKTIAASRTDAGVHALNQKVCVDLEFKIDPTNLQKAINSMIDPAIMVTSVEEVAKDFHPRYDVVSKSYMYVLTQNPNPFAVNYKGIYEGDLNLILMQEAAKVLEGRHDFSAFCAANTQVKNKVRNVTKISVQKQESDIIFTFEADGFLYNMIRIMVGTLVEVGAGKKSVDEVKMILESKDRNCAGKTFSGAGLYLTKISYL